MEIARRLDPDRRSLDLRRRGPAAEQQARSEVPVGADAHLLDVGLDPSVRRLGVHLRAEIAEHAGHVSLVSTSENGTCFQILLPLSLEARANTAEGSLAPQAEASTRILLIDDEEVVRHTARRLMESLGYQVEEAENGQEGVRLFEQKSEDFDMVVLDMVMPRLNGVDAFRKLREIRADVPVILCSGYALDASVSELKSEGLAGHLTKPFRRKELGLALREALPSRS